MRVLKPLADATYIVGVVLFILLIFAFPKCSNGQSYYTAEDFRGAKFRGFNMSYVNTLADLTARDIPKAKAAGANQVRIWIGVNFTAANVPYYCNYAGTKLAASPIPVIDSAVRLCEKLKIAMVLVVEFHPKQGADAFWGNNIRKDSMAGVWKTLATRYKDKKIIAAYDLMNEPRENQTYKTAPTPDRTANQMNTEYIQLTLKIIDTIRKVDPYHTIAVEVLNGDMLWDTLAMRILADSTRSTYRRNLIYSPHGYSPLSITHQGSSTTVPKPFPDPASSTYSNPQYFANVAYWANPRKFAKKYNAVIWVGEFSCVNYAPKNSLGEWTSSRWIKEAINYMQDSVGASWAYHAPNEWQGWDPRYPSEWYYNPANGVTFSNAKPSKFPPASAKTDLAPTWVLLKQQFTKNDTALVNKPFTGSFMTAPAVTYITCPHCNGTGKIIKQ